MSFSLHILGSRQGGGAERFFVRLLTALHKAGHPCEAVVSPDGWADRQLPTCIVRHRIPMRSVHDPLARWRLRRLVRRLEPDIVQTWMGRATRLVRLPPERLPVHVARLGGYYAPKGYRHAHAWIGNTRGIHDYLVQAGFPEHRVFHIGNFVEPPRPVPERERDAWRRRLSLPEGVPVLLALGRLHPNKGFDTLLEAFSLLAHHDQSPLLVLAGGGPQEAALRTLADRLGVERKMRWTGWIDDPAPLYCLADLFVCPSRHEPLGNVILEAWSHGLPVVATDCDGPRELIAEGTNGLLVPRESPDVLAQAIARLLGDQALRVRLGERGEAAWREKHAERRIVTQYLSLYERLKASVGQA